MPALPIVGQQTAIERPSTGLEPPTRFTEQMGAALRRENSLGSLWDWAGKADPSGEVFEYYDVPVEGPFNIRDYLRPEQAHLLPYVEDAESLTEAQEVLDRLHEEVAAQHALADGPMHPIVAAFGAAALDPVSYLSLGAGALYRVGRTAQFVRRSTAAGFASALMAESALQGTQVTRDVAESAANIAASTVFSGGIALGFGAAQRRAIARTRFEAEEREAAEAAGRAFDARQANADMLKAELQARREGRAATYAHAQAGIRRMEERALTEAYERDMTDLLTGQEPNVESMLARIDEASVLRSDVILSEAEADIWRPSLPQTKATDDAGAPVRVFHGTGATFDLFKPQQRGQGLYFSTNPNIASQYAGGEAPQVRPAFLDIRNPLEIDVGGNPYDRIPMTEARRAFPDIPTEELRGVHDDTMTDVSQIEHFARRAGYDSVVFRNLDDGLHAGEKGTTYVVFKGGQVVDPFPAPETRRISGQGPIGIQQQQSMLRSLNAEDTSHRSPGAAAKERTDGETITEPEPERAGFALSLDPGDTLIDDAVARRLSETWAKGRAVGVAPVSTNLITSPIAATRELFLRLGEPSGLLVQGMRNGKNLGSLDMDTRIKADTAVWQAGFLETQKRAYKAYARRMRQSGQTPMTPFKFREQAGRAARRKARHTIPEVSQVAREAARLFEHWRVMANDAGLEVEAKVTTAESYAPRLWDRRKIQDNYGQLLELVARRFQEYGDGSPADLVQTRAREVIEGFLGHGASARVPPAYRTDERGALAERSFNIPDRLVEDFLDNDVESMVTSYLRTMVPDVHLQRTFGAVNPDQEIIPRLVYDDAARMKLEAPEREGEIERRAREDVRTLRWYVSHLRGMDVPERDGAYAGLHRVGQGLRQFGFINLLGSVTISALPDIGRHILAAGFSRTMGTAFAQLGGGLQSLNMSIREAKRMGTAVDIVMATRVRQIMGMDELDPGRTRAERTLQWTAQKAGIVTGMSQWNTAMKAIASGETVDFLLRAGRRVAEGTALSARQRDRIARLNITREELAEIWVRERGNFQDNNGLWNANIDAWADPRLRERFRHAVVREVDNTIITPTGVDVPAWANSPWGRMVSFLRRFMFASVNRTLIAGVQRRDADVLASFSVMLALGAASVAVRDLATGGEVRERTTRQWILNAIDRSGVLGILAEADTLQGRVTGHSLQRMLAGEDADRFAARSVIQQALGPAAGLIENSFKASRQLGDGYATQADIAAMRRLLPFQSLPGLSVAFRELESGIAREFYLPRNRAEATGD